MKILIATGIYPPQIGGPATYSRLLHDELPSRGFGVTVCNFGDVLHLPKVIRHVVYFSRLLSAAKDVDIIYAQDPVSVGLSALLAAQIRGKKFILKIVGDYAWEQGVQRFGITDRLDDFSKVSADYPLRVKFLKKMQAYVAESAEHIVTPSQYLKGIISNWGIDASKVTVIYNGFDFKGVTSTKSTLRSKFGFSGTTIISAGRLVPWKGFSVLIDAFTDVKKSIPDAVLYIAGEGPLRGELEIRVRDQGLTESIIFLGKVPQEELFEYAKASDIFVLNTDYEGFSHQLLETMALGTPIITTPVGGNVELIEDKKTGLFVGYNAQAEISQNILLLARDTVLAEKISKNAKAKVKEFSDERMLDSLTAFLTKLQ